MTIKFLNVLQDKIFVRMYEINKIEFNSLILALVYLFWKSSSNTFMAAVLFFLEEPAFMVMTPYLKNYLTLSSTPQSLNLILITSFFTIFNFFMIILVFNSFKKNINEILNRVLLFLFLLIEAFKGVAIIVLCFQIRQLIKEGDFIFSSINLFNLILFIVWDVLFLQLYFTHSHSNKNYFSNFASFNYNVLEVCAMCLTMIISFMGTQSISFGQKLVINLIFFVIKILVIYFNTLRWYYTNSTVHSYYSHVTMMEAIILLSNIIILLTKEPILSSNFYVCVVITTLFCFFAGQAYFYWKQEDLYFSQAKDIKTQSKVNLYFKALFDISGFGANTTENSLILMSIRKQHELKCHRKQCYCRSMPQNKQFVKHYTIQQLDFIRSNFKNRPKILIQQLYFRFKMFDSYPDILTRLQKIRAHSAFLGFTDKFSVMSLKNQLIEWMSQKNRMNDTIDVQTPLKLEEVIKEMETTIRKDIEKKTKKWKYLSRGLCRTEQLQQDTICEINYVKEMTKIHYEWIQKLKRSTLFNFLLLFYYQKISFLNVNTEDVKKNLREHLKKIKEQELSSTKEFSKCVYHKRSCVIESMIDEQNMGIVTRSSTNVYDLFGYPQNKIIGMNLNKLMPTFMAGEHELILRNWVKTGTWRTIGKLKQIFCIHKEQFCFAAIIYLKIVANQKGLFFIGVIFKKNQSDYLVLNPNQEIQGLGRKFLHLIGANSRKIPISLLFQDFPTNQILKIQQYKSFTKTFRSLKNNQNLVQEYLEEKNHSFLSEEDEKKLLETYRLKLTQSEKLEKWEVKFEAKIYKMREVHFYIILLIYAKMLPQGSAHSIGTLNQTKYDMIVGNGKMNEDEGGEITSSNNVSDETMGDKHSEFFEQKNSSMASFTERQNFTITKLLTVFYGFLINPKKIADKRIKTLNISTLLETLILTTIITIAFVTYMRSVNQISSYIETNGNINESMQQATMMYNKVIGLVEYRRMPQVQSQIIYMTIMDMYQFYDSVELHFKRISSERSPYQSQQLYRYLKDPISWVYHDQKPGIQIQVLQFFQFYYYITGSVFLDVMYEQDLDLLDERQYQIERVKQNFPQLKKLNVQINQRFLNLTKATKQQILLLGWLIMGVFLLITFVFFLYSYNYHHFRYNQKYQSLYIYKYIPPNLIDKVKQYYVNFYQQFFVTNNTNGQGKKQFLNGENFQILDKNQLTIEQNAGHSFHNNNKIKYLGRDKFVSWLGPFLIFLVINTVNFLLTYKILSFVSPLDQFMLSINKIMQSQNQLLETYFDIKGGYLLSQKPQISPQKFNSLLQFMIQNQVSFNEMVTFQSQTLTQYDPTFYDEFYAILVNNVCDEIKDNLNPEEYTACSTLSKTTVLQEGVITFMNHFQRKVRSAIQDLKNFTTVRFQQQGSKYFINRNFTQFDLAITYNIKIFRKLSERILIGYKKGIQYINFINVVVLIVLISPQIFALVMWFHLAQGQKNSLSFLYGAMLMIPPQIIKQVKNLSRMIKVTLQFDQY